MGPVLVAIVVALLIALLAACGREAPSEPAPYSTPPPAAVGAPQADRRPVIAAFGDSLSAGYGVEPGESYPDLLQKLLDEQALAYRIANAGISGDTTSGGLARVDSVLALEPAIVILELGGNDGLRGMPVTATRSNLEQIIVRLRGAGVRVLLAGMTLPRNYGPDYIRSFEAIYAEIAAAHKLPLIPFLLDGVAGDARWMQPDGIHPTAEGNRRVAANVMKRLRPLLGKRRG